MGRLPSITLPPIRAWLLARRIVCFVFALYFMVATIRTAPQQCSDQGCPSLITNLTFWALAIHIVHFASPLSAFQSREHSLLNALAHGASHSISWCIALLVTVMYIHKPSFMADHAKQEGVSTATVWILSALVHYVPPLLHTVELSTAHKLVLFNYVPSAAQKKYTVHVSAVAPLLVWSFLSPFILELCWMAAGFSGKKVYAVDIPLWENYLVTAVASALSTFGLLRLLMNSWNEIAFAAGALPSNDLLTGEAGIFAESSNLLDQTSLSSGVNHADSGCQRQMSSQL